MKKENNSEQKTTSKGKKGAVIGLSVAFALSLCAAAGATTMYLLNKGKVTPEKAKTYTVTFIDDDGKTIYTQEVIKGNKVIEPKVPTKVGKKFKAWLKQNTEETFDFKETIINSNTTLVALWDDEQVTTVNLTFMPGDYGTFKEGSKQPIYKLAYKNSKFSACEKPEILSEKNYAHVGWVKYGETEMFDPNREITEDTTFTAKYENNPAKVNIHLSNTAGDKELDNWTVTVRGETTYTYLESQGKQYKDIKDVLPTAEAVDSYGTKGKFLYWSNEPQTSSFSEPPKEIETAYTFKNGDIIYPVFSFEDPTYTCKLTVHLINDSYHNQTLESGSTTIEVPYKSGSIVKKFKDINKPSIIEKDSSTGKTKVLAGYYREYYPDDGTFGGKWENDDDINGDGDIYVSMTLIATEPVITFEVPEDIGTSKLEWVGMQQMKVTAGTKLSEIAAPLVYKDATPNPERDLGFITKYYFDGWYKKGDVNKTKLNVGTTFSESTTLCPLFKTKTTVAIQKDYTKAADPIKTNYYLDDTTWAQVATPTPDNIPDGKLFTGWYAKVPDESEDYFLLTDENKVGEIKKDTSVEDPTTIAVIPQAEDKDSCHEIKFDTTAFKADGSEYGKAVTFVGAANTAVLMDDNPIVLNQAINKPLIPNTDGENRINEDITFNNQWKIGESDASGTTPQDWKLLDDTFTIPAGKTASDKKYYWIRPVISENVNITFDKNAEDTKATFKEWTVKGQSKTYQNISVSTTTSFGEMFKPEIEFKDEANMSFKYWATKNDRGEFVKVESNATFSKDTTLYAVYGDSQVSSIINFHVTQTDYDDGARLNGKKDFTVAINDNLSELTNKHKFSDFAQPVAKFPLNRLKSGEEWYYFDKDGKKQYISNDTDINFGGNGLDLYANFEKDTGYHKITIKKDESKYFIDGDTEFYVSKNSTPFDLYSHQFKVDGFSTKAWTVGYELIGWKDSSGELIDEKTPITSDLTDIEPIFDTNEKKINVSFSNNGDESISISDASILKVKINDTLLDKISSRSASKTGETFANKWRILNADNSTTEITADTRIKSDTTLVPVFIDEEVYAHGEKPYYYDPVKGKWADITSFDDTQYLYVRYSDNTVGSVEKATFNYRVKIGDKMTTVPDNFMAGCSQWNNGATSEEESIPLVFPECITSVGKNFMFGCASFNHPIVMNIDVKLMAKSVDIFKVGENFMKNCVSFNSKLSMNALNVDTAELKTSRLVFAMADNFMFDCLSFENTIELTGWEQWNYLSPLGEVLEGSAEKFWSCLSSSDPNCKSFTVLLSEDDGEHGILPTSTFKEYFPLLDGSKSWSYRSTIQIKHPE